MTRNVSCTFLRAFRPCSSDFHPVFVVFCGVSRSVSLPRWQTRVEGDRDCQQTMFSPVLDNLLASSGRVECFKGCLTFYYEFTRLVSEPGLCAPHVILGMWVMLEQRSVHHHWPCAPRWSHPSPADITTGTARSGWGGLWTCNTPSPPPVSHPLHKRQATYLNVVNRKTTNTTCCNRTSV